jgi:hypothetical protein
MHDDIPCAAAPSKMLPGVPEHTIVFPTADDRELFQAAVNLADEHKLPLVDALRIAYGIAADIAPALSELDWADECTLYIGKGVLSPFVAVMAAQKQYTGEGASMVAHHVWLRTTIEDARHSDANYVVGNGRPDGKGGSYKATVVQPAGMGPCYDVAVEVKAYPCRVTKQWLDAWDEFTRGLSC